MDLIQRISYASCCDNDAFDAKFMWLNLSLQFAVDFSCTPEKSERHWPANSYQWFGKGVNSFYYLVSVFFCLAPCDLQGCQHVKLWREISTALTSLTSAHWIARVLLQVRPSCQLCTAAASRLVEILGGNLWSDCVTLPQFPFPFFSLLFFMLSVRCFNSVCIQDNECESSRMELGE